CRCLSVVSWSSMANRSTCQRLLHQWSSRPSNARSKRVYDRSRRWLITILRSNITLCMLCILYVSFLLGSDCCRTFFGAVCWAPHLIAISPSVWVMVLSPPSQFRLPVAAYGFTPLRWERYRGYGLLLLPSIPACLNSLLCYLCLHQPANT